MKIALLGSNGQLGSSICKELNKSFKLFKFTKKDLNLTSERDLSKLIKIKPEIIINCAAYTNVEKSEENKDLAYLINSDSLKKLSLVSKKINSLLIHFSTDYVFDGTNPNEYFESDLTRPLNIYGKSKLKGEEAILKSGCNYIILRVSWLFSEYENNFFKTIYNKLINKEDIRVINDQFGKPTYCGDLAKAIRKIIFTIDTDQNYKNLYHYSGGDKVSWFEFAKFIEICIDKKSNLIKPITYKEFNSKAIRPVNSSLNCDLIKEDFDIHSGNWKEGVIYLINREKKSHEK